MNETADNATTNEALGRPNVYHLDCFSGLAGDMFLGACIDLGLEVELLQEAVDRLDLSGVELEARRSTRGGIGGVRFRVLQGGHSVEGLDPEEGARLAVGPAVASTEEHSAHHHQHQQQHGHSEEKDPSGGEHTHRSLSEILRMIDRSGLPEPVAERAHAMFVSLGEVEAGIHQVDLDEVHFHEVGAVDSIVDIVGAAVAIEYLAPKRVTAGSIVVGSGMIKTAHGVLPVPAPATLALLGGAPIVPGPVGELLTPTGALILSHLKPEYGQGPSFIVDRQGFGLGRWQLQDRANAVRLSVGYEAADSSSSVPGPSATRPTITVLECQIDDLTGEGFGHLLERLLDEGALDVFYTPVQMKKSRPGILVTVLVRPGELENLAGTLMLESGSLGCRYTLMHRFEAQRQWLTVTTQFGPVRIKQAWIDGRMISQAPEYEDCRKLAIENDRAWREIYAQALAAIPLAGEGTIGTGDNCER